MLEAKQSNTIQILIDMLELDESERVRTRVLKALFDLYWFVSHCSAEPQFPASHQAVDLRAQCNHSNLCSLFPNILFVPLNKRK